MDNSLSLKYNKLNYILTYLIVAFSGIIVFDEWKVGKIGFFIILWILFIKKKRKLDPEVVAVIAISVILVGYNVLFWGESPLFFITFLIYYILPPYFALKIIGPNFFRYFVNILYCYAIIGLVFWLGTSFLSSVQSLSWQLAVFVNKFTPWYPFPESYILYDYETLRIGAFIRNPGPFHEAGAFAVFLVLALMFNIQYTRKLNSRKNIVFIISIISTFSTSGYLALFLLILFYFSFSKHDIAKKSFALLLFSGIIIYSITTADFLGNKIESKYSTESNKNLNQATSGRIFSFRKAIVSIQENPVFGKGLYIGSRGLSTDTDYSGYGWATWVARIGIPLGFLYFFMVYFGIKKYSIINNFNVKYAFWGFIAVMIVLFSQKHSATYIIFTIIYLGLIYKKKYS